MHDPEFEKEVQRKMEDLVFTPSASVWMGVEQAVNKDKRRRVSLYWWFLLPGLLLTGAGWFYFSSRAPHIPQPGTDHAAYPAASASTDPVTAEHPARSEYHLVTPDHKSSPEPMGTAGHRTAAGGHTAPESHAVPESHAADRPAMMPAATAATTVPATAGADGTTAGADLSAADPSAADPSSADHTVSAEHTVSARHNHIVITHDHLANHHNGNVNPAVANPAHVPFFASGMNNTQDANKIVPGVRGSAGAGPYDAPVPIPLQKDGLMAHKVMLPALAGAGPRTPGITIAITGPASAVVTVKSSPAAAPKPAYKWEAGFTGGFGVSSLNESFLRATTIHSTIGVSAAPITGNPGNNTTSSVQQDLSYWAGIYLQWPVQRRLTVSAGLNLHYFSNSIRIGQEVNYNTNDSVQSASLFTNQMTYAAARPSTPYFAAGTNYTYTNHYYFLELPVSVSWRFNRSNHTQLFWEGGFSMSYLVSSNAVNYDMHSGFYLKGGVPFNKTQFNLSTAVLVGLPIGGGRLAFGPQLSYGLTSLVNTAAAGAEHLVYGGIKVVFAPKNRHPLLTAL